MPKSGGGGGSAGASSGASTARLASSGVPHFGETKGATVKYYDGVRREVNKTSVKLFGRKLSDKEYASLAGAPDGARVSVSVEGNRIAVGWGHSTGSATRYLTGKSIHNNQIDVNPNLQRQSLGLKSFARQVEAAQKLGVKSIGALAAKGDTLVGYKVLPKLGYDAPIPASVKSHFPKATKISQLMRTKAGQEAWARHGVQTEMTFDTSKGSYGMRRLTAYLKAKLGR